MTSGLNTGSKPPGILLVDDDPEDARLMERALTRTNPDRPLAHVPGGAEALAYLRRQPPHTDAAFPGVILLDWNMPGMNGLETLQEIRRDVSLRRLPVIILTTSEAPQDVVDSYDAGATAFVTKPSGIAETKEVVGTIEDFWFGSCVLPPEPRR